MAEATIQLETTLELKGQVVTPEGLPAANLTFLFQPKITDSELFTTQERIKSSPDGTFKIKNVCPKVALCRVLVFG